MLASSVHTEASFNKYLLELKFSALFVLVFAPLPTPAPVGAFCIPVYIPYILTGRWMLGQGLCKLWLVMDYLLCSASVFSIVLISYDRFLSVTRVVSGTSSPSRLRGSESTQ